MIPTNQMYKMFLHVHNGAGESITKEFSPFVTIDEKGKDVSPSWTFRAIMDMIPAKFSRDSFKEEVTFELQYVDILDRSRLFKDTLCSAWIQRDEYNGLKLWTVSLPEEDPTVAKGQTWTKTKHSFVDKLSAESLLIDYMIEVARHARHELNQMEEEVCPY